MLQVICISNTYLPDFESAVNQRLAQIDAEPTIEFNLISFETVRQQQANMGMDMIVYLAYITYAVVPQPKAESTVVTPPTPAEVRNEKEAAEEQTDRSLDSQLSDPELGNE